MSPSSPAGSSSSLPSSNALLAIPDGPIPSGHSDRTSHCISLIGGYPTFPALPAASKAPESIRCGVCHEAIPLLAQVYCPPESGENDRTVYVWACPKSSCQRRDGSVRAFRASARNEEYMKDVAEKRAAAEKLAAEEREKAKKNPFTMGSTSNGSSLFGSAQPLFGAAPDVSANPFSAPNAPSAVPDISMLSINPTESTTMNLTTLAPPLPAYQPPQYISTIDEYLPEPDDDEYDMDDDEDGEQTAEQKAAEFADPRWEQLLSPHLDEVFERFVKRIQGAEDAASQVLRYDFGGVPLPYSWKSPLYHKIFPGAPTKRTPDDEEEPDFAEYYSTKAIPPCGQCGGGRIFELQLVPSLISQLQPESLTTTGDIAKKSSGKQTEEERKKELAKIAAALRDGGGDAVGEMEWGSIVVFGCENDCVGFAEEWVGVEWEGKLAGESS